MAKKIRRKFRKNVQLTRPQKSDPVLIAEALIASKGMVSSAAEIMGMTAPTLNKKIKENPLLKELVQHIAMKRINNAETALDDLIEARDFKAIKFLLETKGRDEGYGREAVINHNVQRSGVLVIEQPSHDPAEWSKKALENRKEQNLQEKTVELLKNLEGTYE